jgi:hypothetical protein
MTTVLPLVRALPGVLQRWHAPMDSTDSSRLSIVLSCTQMFAWPNVQFKGKMAWCTIWLDTHRQSKQGKDNSV